MTERDSWIRSAPASFSVRFAFYVNFGTQKTQIIDCGDSLTEDAIQRLLRKEWALENFAELQGFADNYVCGFCKCALWECSHFKWSEGITFLCPGITIETENLTGTDTSQFNFFLIQLPLCTFICISLVPGKHKFYAMIKSQLGIVKSARCIGLSLIIYMRYSEDGGRRKRVPLTNWQANLFTRLNGVIF
jgi:hypothetical protein